MLIFEVRTQSGAQPFAVPLPQIGHGTGAYHDLMLPIGFSGKVTVIPRDDEFRARTLYFYNRQDDEIIPQFALNFDLGRLSRPARQAAAETPKRMPVSWDGRMYCL